MVAQPLPAMSLRVAVIDDDVRFIRFVERALQLEGVAVQPVTTLDPDEALRVVSVAQCDAALVDLYMYGDAKGFEFIERLRADPATSALPVVLTTGARREVGRNVEFLQEQRCSILLKPFGSDELSQLIRDICAEGGGTPSAADVQRSMTRPRLPRRRR